MLKEKAKPKRANGSDFTAVPVLADSELSTREVGLVDTRRSARERKTCGRKPGFRTGLSRRQYLFRGLTAETAGCRCFGVYQARPINRLGLNAMRVNPLQPQHSAHRGLTAGALLTARIERFGPACKVISRRAGEAQGTACRCHQGDESCGVIVEPRHRHSAHRGGVKLAETESGGR